MVMRGLGILTGTGAIETRASNRAEIRGRKTCKVRVPYVPLYALPIRRAAKKSHNIL